MGVDRRPTEKRGGALRRGAEADRWIGSALCFVLAVLAAGTLGLAAFDANRSREPSASIHDRTLTAMGPR
jgi:hypothetical protein